MNQINSVLLEGEIQTVKRKRTQAGGYWVEIRNRREKGRDADGASHRFRIDIGPNLRGCRPELFTIGRSIRIIGSLRREGRLGQVVRAEMVELKGQVAEATI
jgi:hypothetical protein